MARSVTNRTAHVQILYAADGDTVQIQPHATHVVDDKFLEFQKPSPGTVRVVSATPTARVTEASPSDREDDTDE